MRGDRSIRKTLMLITMATSCGAVLAATCIFLYSQYRRSETSMIRSVSVLAEVIGLNAAPTLLFDDAASASETLAALAAEEHVLAAALYQMDGRIFVSYVRPDVTDFAAPELEGAGIRWSKEHLDLGQEIVVDRETIGTVFIRYDTGEARATLREFTFIGLLMFAIAAGVSWLGASRLRAQIATPLVELAAGSERMAGGDLSARVELRNEDELGILARAFNRMAESLAALVARVRGNSRSVAEVTVRLQQASDAMHVEAAKQNAAVEDTGRSIEHMGRSIESVNANVEALSQTATETSSAALEMDTSIQGIGVHVDELSITIDQTASSVVQMTSAIGEIARGADTLNEATTSTSESLELLGRSVGEVEQTAQQSHALAEQASARAERGVLSVGQTVTGMKAIQSSFQGLEQIIGSLEEKSQSIGEVVKVIEGVVEQTNLLALNAAIISSHAGEHGRAFAVVAQEVKNLADRTAGSTRQIVSLIESVQGEVTSAVHAMAQGGERVEKGVALSTEAGVILEDIGQSAKESIQMATDIVHVTGSQAHDIERVDAAMHQVQEIVKQVNRGTHEQDSASAEITRSVERMRQLGKDVKRSTEEQRKESQHITEAVEIVATQITEILAATTDQAKQADQILQALQVFREITGQSGRRAEEMKQTVEILSSRAEELQEEVGRFSL